jgi:hypothetical protein
MQRETIEWCDIWIEDGHHTEHPRVLLIGDSITRSYFEPVSRALAGMASCARLTTSKCVGDPALLLELSLVLGQYSFDVVHINNGLHGIDNSDAFYVEHFPEFVTHIQRVAPRARLIWASTTPWRIADDVTILHPNTERVKLRNTHAQQWLASAGIPLDDLFSLVIDHPEYHSRDGVHFNETGQKVLASQVVQYITEALSQQR